MDLAGPLQGVSPPTLIGSTVAVGGGSSTGGLGKRPKPHRGQVEKGNLESGKVLDFYRPDRLGRLELKDPGISKIPRPGLEK
jgi:hypothetical protein